MSNYLTHFEDLYNTQTFKRKVDYLKYNLKDVLKDLSPKNSVILEIGPGFGEFESLINDAGFEDIDIVDNDKAVLDYISKNYKIKNKFLSGNLVKLDNLLRTYDVILMVQVLEHLPLSQQESVIKILYKHLKKGGSLIIVVPNGGNPLSVVERYSDIQHTCIFTEQSLKDLVNLLNIDGLKSNIKSYEIPPNNLVNILRRLMQKVLHAILLLVLIINGGIFFKIMTPNIMLIINKGENH